jgi:enoyl-CoA hydratase/carnithine racemase
MTGRVPDLLDTGLPAGLPDGRIVVAEAAHGAPGCGHVMVSVDRDGVLPQVDPALFDVLLTAFPGAPAPWVSVPPHRLDAQIARISANVAAAPIASAMLCRVLRMGEGLAFETALELESLAYSALLGGAEFARWRAARGDVPAAVTAPEPVSYSRDNNMVSLTLASPQSRNAMTAALRDALHEALANVVEDPSRPTLILSGKGRCFSTGGDLAEFGTATDLAQAHLIRTARSSARLLAGLGDRAEVVLHGACIGSGIEIAAAAGRRLARSGMFAQLPELAMGLIPGAGGTVTLPRAIGRHRTAWMVLTGQRILAAQALEWGLLGEVLA